MSACVHGHQTPPSSTCANAGRKTTATPLPGEPWALFFDLDGTLLFENGVPASAVQALTRAHAAGHRIFLNTGRSRSNLPPALLQTLPLDGIVAGGAFVEYRGRVLLNHVLAPAQLQLIAHLFRRYDTPLRLEGVTHCYELSHTPVVSEPIVPGSPMVPLFIDEFERQIETHGDALQITKFTCFSPLRFSEPAEIQGLDPLYHPDYTEVFAAGFNKATGLQLAAEKTNIPLSHTAAFGDSLNDVSMLRCAALSAVPAHAPAELDAVASYRAVADEDGVAEALEHFRLLG